MIKIKTFKLSQDQILEIITEHLAEQNQYGTFCSKAQLYGELGNDLRLLVVIGNEEEFDNVDKVNMDKLDETIPLEKIPEWAELNCKE